MSVGCGDARRFRKQAIGELNRAVSFVLTALFICVWDKSQILLLVGRAGLVRLNQGQVKFLGELFVLFCSFGRRFRSVCLVGFFPPAADVAEHFAFTRFHHNRLTPSD